MMELRDSETSKEVRLDQVFFSTTDERGIIELYNNVFVELAAFTPEELSGAPHNLIRHPDMPAGAFYAMWETLKSGSPFAAYVRNLASDGKNYDVFATVTCLPDGKYLSVRTRPVVGALYDAAEGIYKRTLALENEERARGLNRHEASIKGAEAIGEELAKLGFNSYAEFQQFALPAEVSERERLGHTFPYRPDASGIYKDLLDAVENLYNTLGSWMADQDSLASLVADINEVVADLDAELKDESLTNAGGANSSIAEFSMIWQQTRTIIQSYLVGLVNNLNELRESSSVTRFKVALARLHTMQMGTFTSGIIDGSSNEDLVFASIQCLSQAVDDGVADMEVQSKAHSKLAGDIAAAIRKSSSFITIPRQMLEVWIAQNSATADSDFAALVTERSARLQKTLEKLTSIDQRCTELSAKPHETSLSEKASDVSTRVSQIIANMS